MTKFTARRAIAGGRKARVLSQTAPTNLKSPTNKPMASTNRGASPFIYRHIDVQGNADFQTDGFASRY
jgi:hypothetical protein